nr:MAG TPA_asm: hypothetical protein [Caudoviricetes sp.]
MIKITEAIVKQHLVNFNKSLCLREEYHYLSQEINLYLEEI